MLTGQGPVLFALKTPALDQTQPGRLPVTSGRYARFGQGETGLAVLALILFGMLMTTCGMRQAFAQEPPVVPWVAFTDPGTPRIEVPETGRIDFLQPDSFCHLVDGWRSFQSDAYVFEAQGEKKGLGCPTLVSRIAVQVLHPRELTLRLSLWAHVDAMLPEQEVGIAWNAMRLGVCRFEKQGGWQPREFTFDVPAAAMVAGDNVITFTARYCVSPQQLGRGSDSRMLSFGLVSLELMNKSAEGQTAAPAGDASKFQYENGGLTQHANSRAVFPVRLPAQPSAALSLNGAPTADHVTGRVTVRWDRPEGPDERVLLERAAAAETGVQIIELSGLEGRLVEFVFEVLSPSGEGAVQWNHPFLFTREPIPPAPEPGVPLAVTPVENVVFVILDALREDRLGCSGWIRDTTPFIDSLAQRGIRFRRAYSAAPYTFSSTFSLLTGLYQFQHQAPQVPKRPADALPRLPGVLRAGKLITGCVSANRYLSPEVGTGEGFDEFLPAFENLAAVRTAGVEDLLEGDPGLATRQAREFMQRHAGERFFLYVHYRQPHAPYFAPGDFAGSLTYDPINSLPPESGVQRAVNDRRRALTLVELQHFQARYEENLRAVDAEVSVLWQTLEELGLTGKTAFILTSDHGEAFLEHGLVGHSNSVYNEETHVPLIVTAPMLADQAGSVRDYTVSNVDYFPTICALLGQAVPPGLPGECILNAPGNADDVLAMAQNDQDVTPDEGYWFSRYKLVLNRFRHDIEVYDLTVDPAEQDNLAKTFPVLANHLRARAEAWKKAHQPDPNLGATQGQALDTGVEEQLEALGYVQ